MGCWKVRRAAIEGGWGQSSFSTPAGLWKAEHSSEDYAERPTIDRTTTNIHDDNIWLPLQEVIVSGEAPRCAKPHDLGPFPSTCKGRRE